MKNIIALAVLVSGICASGYAQGKSGMEKILGERTLPNVTLTDVSGKKVNVQDYGKTGKVTVLDFWATWCIPCKKELNNISEVYEDWQKKYNVNIVAVSIDDSRSAPKVKPYVDGQRWTYDVLLDVNQDLKRQLNIQTVPFTLVLDQNGKIIYEHSGYTEGDENILEDAIAGLATAKK
ncbi:MAG: TlpA family protein disulfide reductase [Bacteroidetes bacterium]|nr:TlpA family protein disulfide reductase [Bacteroidota bacterium]MBS1685704.1 TlpA family protein disulfide reductase [Bacteroidota bacterium]